MNSREYNAYIQRPTAPQRYLVLPGVDSGSPLMLDFLARLHEAVTAELQPSEPDGSLLMYPGIPDKWSKFFNVLGHPHNPLGVPPYKALGARAALKSSGKKVPDATLAPKALDRARLLASRFFGDGGDETVYVMRGVNQGVPGMAKDALTLAAIIDGTIQNARSYAAAWRALDAVRLADLGVYNAYYVAYRQQPDSVPDGLAKPRIVEDWHDKWVIADKKLSDAYFARGKRFYACRARKLNASSLAASWPLRILAARGQAHLEKRYPLIKYHPSGAAVLEKLARFEDVRLYDFDNHDIFIPLEVRDVIIERIAELWGPTWANQLRGTLRAPTIIKNDYMQGRGVRVVGDIFNSAGWEGDYVNPSGHPFTSLIATFAGLFNWYDALCESGALQDGTEGLDALLTGTADAIVLIQGDNAVVAGPKNTLDRVEQAQRYGVASTTETFLGNVICTKHGRRYALPDLTSYLLGFWLPSRPIDAPLRGNFATGWLERRTQFKVHPSFATIDRIEREIVKTVFGFDMEEEMRAQRPEPDARTPVGFYEAMFAQDPDGVHYKFAPKDLSPETLLTKFFPIPPNYYRRLLDEYAR